MSGPMGTDAGPHLRTHLLHLHPRCRIASRRFHSPTGCRWLSAVPRVFCSDLLNTLHIAHDPYGIIWRLGRVLVDQETQAWRQKHIQDMEVSWKTEGKIPPKALRLPRLQSRKDTPEFASCALDTARTGALNLTSGFSPNTLFTGLRTG